MKCEAIQVGFCENGAGYGGAVISLAAFLEKIPVQFRAHLFTSLAASEYRLLARFGRWHHMPQSALLSPALLKRHTLPFASSLDNVFNLLPYALRYYRAFRRERIGLVYLNNDASCNMAAALAGKLAGLPLVLHARGFNADTKGNRWVLANLEHCIAVSRAVKAGLIALGMPPEKCTVVPEGLDLTQFHPRPPEQSLRRELGIGDDQPVITLVGGLVDWKGQDILLAAAPMILERFPNAHILLVGAAYGKEDDYPRLIAERAAAPVLRGRVRLLGARQDIPNLLSISTVVLHASTKPEPFGRTFLEGMALGKAVIASNEGGPLDVIDDGVDGLLIAPGDPAALAGAVLRLLDQPALAERLGQNAAVKARAYSIENHAAAISAILRTVLQQRPAGA